MPAAFASNFFVLTVFNFFALDLGSATVGSTTVDSITVAARFLPGRGMSDARRVDVLGTGITEARTLTSRADRRGI
jgi:hypothetical protein